MIEDEQIRKLCQLLKISFYDSWALHEQGQEHEQGQNWDKGDKNKGDNNNDDSLITESCPGAIADYIFHTIQFEVNKNIIKHILNLHFLLKLNT